MMAKLLLLARHAQRQGTRLTDVGRREAAKFKALAIDYLFHSGALWSLETAYEIVCNYPLFVKSGPAITELNPQDIIKDIFTTEVAELEKQGVATFDAIDRIHPRHLVSQWEERLAGGIRQIFEMMDDWKVALAIGHDPYIQMAIRGMGISSDIPKAMPELSFFHLVEEDGKLSSHFHPRLLSPD